MSSPLLNHRFELDRLLVVIPDRISALAKKGEVTERYYNPGELFKEVHFLICNDDRPDPAHLQRMVGNAKFFVYNLPPPSFFRSLAWRLPPTRAWLEEAASIVRKIRPQLMRAYNNDWNGLVADRIRSELGVPYVLSMHINPDADLRFHARRDRRWKRILYLALTAKHEAIGIRNADIILPVYQWIVPYLRKHRAARYEVIYNTVNPSRLRKKMEYARKEIFRGIIVGRQFRQKDPGPVIRAMRRLPDFELTLAGNGEIHEELRSLAAECGVADRCRFLTSVPNDVLADTLCDYDVLISANEYGGISKVELEAAHVGMPIITNAHPQEVAPELLGGASLLTDGSEAGYEQAIRRLAGDEGLRRKLGEAALTAVREITPLTQELKTVDIYRKFALRA